MTYYNRLTKYHDFSSQTLKHRTKNDYQNKIVARGKDLGTQPTLTQPESMWHVTCQFIRRNDTTCTPRDKPVAIEVTRRHSAQHQWNGTGSGTTDPTRRFPRFLQISDTRERPFFLLLLSTTRTACYFYLVDNIFTWIWGLLKISDTREHPFFLSLLATAPLPAIFTW